MRKNKLQHHVHLNRTKSFLHCLDHVIDWVYWPQLAFYLHINSLTFGWDLVCPIKNHVTDSKKELANTYVSFTVENQIKAHLFQQQTHKHCCSFHPLWGHTFFQQLSSCKISLWKSCIPSLDRLMNVLSKQTAATQMLVTRFEDVTIT